MNVDGHCTVNRPCKKCKKSAWWKALSKAKRKAWGEAKKPGIPWDRTAPLLPRAKKEPK